MQVRDAMTSSLRMIRPEASIRDAARKMAELDINVLAVSNGTILLGLISDRDLTIYGLASDLDLESATVEDVMIPSVVTCKEQDDVEQVVEIMARNRVRRIVVVDENDQPRGLFSIDDLASHTSDEHLLAQSMAKITSAMTEAQH